MSNERKNTKVVIGPVRFSYAHVWAPSAAEGSDTEKYSVSVIIPKGDKKVIKQVNTAIEHAVEAGISSKFGGKRPTNLKLPLRDGDEERPEDEVYADSYFFNASSITKPGIVDKNHQPIIEQEEFYSGCYGYVSVNFYAFNVSGNKGVAAGLNNLMKTKDGEALGGRETAEHDFADIEIGDGDDDDEDDFFE